MRAAPLPRMLTNGVVATAAAAAASAAVGVKQQQQQRALVHASLAAAATVGRKGRHLTGTFCLTGDTMEGIIQCLVFLKAFSVSGTHTHTHIQTTHTYKLHTHTHTHTDWKAKPTQFDIFCTKFNLVFGLRLTKFFFFRPCPPLTRQPTSCQAMAIKMCNRL